MAKKINDRRMDRLFEAILTLKSVEECYDFFGDLCTVPELAEMSKRLEAASLLKSGVVYTDIAEKTGLSTATISRINRCIQYGPGGYHEIIERTKQKD